jgi:hypothetical protein
MPQSAEYVGYLPPIVLIALAACLLFGWDYKFHLPFNWWPVKRPEKVAVIQIPTSDSLKVDAGLLVAQRDFLRLKHQRFSEIEQRLEAKWKAVADFALSRAPPDNGGAIDRGWWRSWELQPRNLENDVKELEKVLREVGIVVSLWRYPDIPIYAPKSETITTPRIKHEYEVSYNCYTTAKSEISRAQIKLDMALNAAEIRVQNLGKHNV